MDTYRLERIIRDYKKYNVITTDDLNFLIAEITRLQVENKTLTINHEIDVQLNVDLRKEITRLQGELDNMTDTINSIDTRTP